MDKGYLLRLKNGWYAMASVKDLTEYDRVAAERIYRPSYISLQTALSIYDIIPEMLFELGLTGHREERFLLKVEAQDQSIEYKPVTALVNKCGFFINVLTPPDDILMSMKLSALLSRAKGRDFYDVMFLSQLAKPNYGFLESKHGIKNIETLKGALLEVSARTVGSFLEVGRGLAGSIFRRGAWR